MNAPQYLLIIENQWLHDYATFRHGQSHNSDNIYCFLFLMSINLNMILPELELLGRSRHSTTLRAMFSFTDFAMESKLR